MLSRLTINSTQTCNLGCTYCYALGGDYGGPAIHMRPHLAIKKLRETALSHREIELIQFIGGEPLLNLATLRAVASEVDVLVSEGILSGKPRMSAVTNLTFLSKDHLELFRQHRFQLVVSLDGPQVIHDALRPTKAGKGTHQTIMQNLGSLAENEIPYDVECTYTYEHYSAGISIKDLLIYFSQRTKAHEINIVVVSTSPGDKSGFNDHGDWRIPVRLQLEALQFVLDQMEVGHFIPYGLFIETLGQIRAPGTDNYCPAGVSNLAVASDGKLYQCNMFTNNSAYEVSISAKAKVLTKLDIAECRECWARPWCRACVGNMEIRSPGDPHPYPQHCETLRGAVSLIIQRLPSVLDAVLSLPSSPDRTMAEADEVLERLESLQPIEPLIPSYAAASSMPGSTAGSKVFIPLASISRRSR